MTSTDTDPVYFLLVDDLEGNLLSLEGLLRRNGVILLKARSGTEALELLLKHDVALAILDVQMPVMDGFELAEIMRGSERTCRIPLIFLTAGSADHQRRFRGYEAGAVDFLHKPIEPDILRSKADVFRELFLQRRQLANQRDALKAYAEKLEEADQRKDEFLAVLAHELRNPLTPIRYGLDIVRLAPDAPVPEDLRAMMDRQLTHLVRLIDDLLDVSRISRGKIELKKEHVAFQAILQAAIEASRPSIEARRHTFTLEIPDEPMWLHADMTRIAQVISNLLNNAAKFTPEGGRIQLSVFRTDCEIVVSISDSGIGISREMLPRIFDLFTQVEIRGARSGGGLGIGLALARQLVTLHDGTIEAASSGSESGSTFTVRLPLENRAPQPREEDPRIEIEGNSVKILVVDDNVSSAETTGRILTLVGHQVALAHDGPQALKTAREFAPDAIILDIGMPGMSGYEVCRKLRADPAFERTLLIAQTGWGQERDREKTREAGFDFHLTKPVNFKELSSLLERV